MIIDSYKIFYNNIIILPNGWIMNIGNNMTSKENFSNCINKSESDSFYFI